MNYSTTEIAFGVFLLVLFGIILLTLLKFGWVVFKLLLGVGIIYGLYRVAKSFLEGKENK